MINNKLFFLKKPQNTYKLMLLPCLLILAIIVIAPIINLVYFSFQQYELSNPSNTHFNGLFNYIQAFKDELFIKSIGVTGLYIIGVLLIEVPLALILMELLNSLGRLGSFLRVLFLPPMIIAPIVAGVIWRILYHPTSGMINYFLSIFFNIKHGWLADPSTALLSLVIVDVWMYTPFLLFIFLAGRAAISEHIYEASMIDGANRFQIFRNVTLPLINKQLMVGVLFRVIDSIRIFPTIHIMTAGGPSNSTQTINYYTYRVAFQYTDIGYSSALGFLLLVMSLLLSLILVKVFVGREKR